jgi:hypothetical protein
MQIKCRSKTKKIKNVDVSPRTPYISHMRPYSAGLPEFQMNDVTRMQGVYV